MNSKSAGLYYVLFVLVLLIFTSGLQADYPDPNDQFINDYAKLLTDYDRNVIRDLFINLEKETGKQAVVVTIESIYDYKTGDNTIESFATNLFNKWGVGNIENNDGVMILVARTDRKCRIELGGGYGRRYDSAMKNVVDRKMVPHFKRDKYSLGIREGATFTVDGVTRKVSFMIYYKWHILIGFIAIICIIAGFSCIISGKKSWGWLMYAGIGGLLMVIIDILLPYGGRTSRYSDWGSSSSGGGGGSFGGGFGGGGSFGGGASGSW